MKIEFYFISLLSTLIKMNKILKGNILIHSDRPQSYISIHQDNSEKSLYINTYLSYSLAFPFPMLRQSDIKENNTIYLHTKYNTFRYQSDIMLDTIEVYNYSIYYTYGYGVVDYDYGLGFGYHIKENSFSFVHTLYNNNQISKLQFAFYNIVKELNHTLYLGGIPNNEHKKLPYKANIKINEELPTLGFKLNKVKFDNETFEMNISAIICSVIDEFFINDELMTILSKKIIDEEHCQHNTISLIDNIICMNEASVLNSNVSFYFEDVIISFKVKNFFSRYNETHMTSTNQIHNQYYLYNYTEMILGAFFINQFNYTIFDYEDKSVSFYSDCIDIQSKKKYKILIIEITIINSIICVINAFILIKNLFTK